MQFHRAEKARISISLKGRIEFTKKAAFTEPRILKRKIKLP